MPPITLIKAVNDYITALRQDGVKSANTIRAQTSDLIHISRRFGDRPLPTISGEDVGSYFDSLIAKNRYAYSSIIRIWSTTVSFFDFCAAKEYISENPLSDNKLPIKAEIHTPTILTRAEVRRLLQVPVKERKRVGKKLKERQRKRLPAAALETQVFDSMRNRAILELMFATGIRPGELVKLTQKDFNFANCSVVIENRKGEKRTGYFPNDEVKNALQEYRSMAEQLRSEKNKVHSASPDFFLNRNGRPIGEETLCRIVRRCADAAGIKKTVTPYTLRHTLTALLLKAGTDTHAIRILLGGVFNRKIPRFF